MNRDLQNDVAAFVQATVGHPAFQPAQDTAEQMAEQARAAIEERTRRALDDERYLIKNTMSKFRDVQDAVFATRGELVTATLSTVANVFNARRDEELAEADAARAQRDAANPGPVPQWLVDARNRDDTITRSHYATRKALVAGAFAEQIREHHLADNRSRDELAERTLDLILQERRAAKDLLTDPVAIGERDAARAQAWAEARQAHLDRHT